MRVQSVVMTSMRSTLLKLWKLHSLVEFRDKGNWVRVRHKTFRVRLCEKIKYTVKRKKELL